MKLIYLLSSICYIFRVAIASYYNCFVWKFINLHWGIAIWFMWRIICCKRVEIVCIILILANPPPPPHNPHQNQRWQMTNVPKHSPDASNLFNVLYRNMDKKLCNSGYLLALVCIYCNFYGTVNSHWLWLEDKLILNSVTGFNSSTGVLYSVLSPQLHRIYEQSHELPSDWSEGRLTRLHCTSKSVCPIPSSVATL